LAKNTSRKGLTISAGWILKGPIGIHLTAPLVTCPINKGNSSNTMLPQYICFENKEIISKSITKNRKNAKIDRMK
jgi:hypothetical protein